ncbi:MAG: transporter substrate-binding domain-containing protein [Deltaproteobacteria bacterium]|jgi:ABC-type amino acid transport substrate-binding protein|nr:transporter substrate-binding domain-containing protein [Deltaproteobacteria bacterium]
MKRVYFLSPVLCLLIILFSHIQLLALDKDRVYKIAVDINYPPFSSIDEKTGRLVGFDVEIAKAVCKTIGIQCEVLAVSFDQIIPMVLRGDADVGCAGFGFTPEREKILLFTDKYYRTNSIFVQSDLDLVEINPQLIKGKTVAVQRGTIHEEYLRTNFPDIINILLCNTFGEVMDAVKNKRADLGFADGIPTYTYLKTEAGRSLDIAGDPIFIKDDDCLMILHRDAVELRDSINLAIKELRSTGEYDLINLKYFDYNIY